MSKDTKYRWSFTTGGLLTEESIRIAAMKDSNTQWKDVRVKAIELNVLQARTRSTAVRVTGEVVQRLSQLTAEELEFFLSTTPSDKCLVLWIAACKTYRIIREFAEEVVNNNWLNMILHLHRNDFEQFMDRKSIWQEEIERLAPSTLARLSSNVYQMLKEASIISKDLDIQPQLLSRELTQVMMQRSAAWLSVIPAVETRDRGGKK